MNLIVLSLTDGVDLMGVMTHEEIYDGTTTIKFPISISTRTTTTKSGGFGMSTMLSPYASTGFDGITTIMNNQIVSMSRPNDIIAGQYLNYFGELASIEIASTIFETVGHDSVRLDPTTTSTQ